MSVGSFEVCDCDCHRMPGVYHMMPCCYTCPHCKQNIRRGYFDSHVEKCKSHRDSIRLSVEAVYKDDN